MDNKYAVSVIIPTYNRAQLLNYTLRSLSLQQLPVSDFEVIVCDDGSTDNTKEIAEAYQTKMNVRYVFQEDKGFRPGSARNMGIRNAQGEICAFIDCGVLADTHCLEGFILGHRLSKSPVATLGLVYGFAEDEAQRKAMKSLIDLNNPAETIRSFYQNSLYPDLREVHYKKYNDRIENLPAPWLFFWTCNVSVQRQHLLDIGLFDEKYDGNWGCEDNDLGIRLLQHGVKIVVNRHALSIHYPHDHDVAGKKDQGYINCKYLHEKFNTHETARFLEAFTNKEFTDVNEVLLKEQYALSEQPN